mmetsp:Transcript_9862/g.24006  ORF Transcript_9862/g.24006 Transcript_9862/m.24006 type:complete len:92 (-) Transcript_9862:586-861(-)
MLCTCLKACLVYPSMVHPSYVQNVRPLSLPSSINLIAFDFAAIHSAVATREVVHPLPSLLAMFMQLLFTMMYVDNVYVRFGKKHSMTSSYM